MDWINSLTGLSPGALLVVLVIAFLANIPNVIKLITFFKKKKIKAERFSENEKMLNEGEKALNDCRALIIKAIPPEFNGLQTVVIELMLWKAFIGSCLLHIRGLVSRNGFATMSPERFHQYCEEETPRVMRAVSDDMSDTWKKIPFFFPIERKVYEKHNYDMCSSECGEIIVNWFKFCRAVKKKEQGIV